MTIWENRSIRPGCWKPSPGDRRRIERQSRRPGRRLETSNARQDRRPWRSLDQGNAPRRHGATSRLRSGLRPVFPHIVECHGCSSERRRASRVRDQRTFTRSRSAFRISETFLSGPTTTWTGAPICSLRRRSRRPTPHRAYPRVRLVLDQQFDVAIRPLVIARPRPEEADGPHLLAIEQTPLGAQLGDEFDAFHAGS